MSVFFRLFGLNKEKLTSIRKDIDIAEAINAHMKWKARLQSCLDGTSEEVLDPKVIGRDDLCTLGKWIHGPALNHFHDDESLEILRADHAQFHNIAGNVITKIQQNDISGAMTLFHGEYVKASRKVIHTLTELNKHLCEA